MANSAELDIIIQIQNRAGNALSSLTREVNALTSALGKLETKSATLDRLNRLLATTASMSGNVTATGNAIKDMSDKFAGLQLIARISCCIWNIPTA